MKKFAGNKKGQFVLIAVLLVAIMLISTGALMHGAVTYYKHEPWEEYLTLIANIELNSRRLVELSLANYTQTLDDSILEANLDNWQTNLNTMYPSSGIALTATSMELIHTWNQTAAISSGQSDFTLNISSIGLTGYKFTAKAFLKLKILNANSENVTVTVKAEDNKPLTDLSKNNFQVIEPANTTITKVTPLYHSTEVYVYVIRCEAPITNPVTVTVWDQRGIFATARLS
jgi:hypothetical protein